MDVGRWTSTSGSTAWQALFSGMILWGTVIVAAVRERCLRLRRARSKFVIATVVQLVPTWTNERHAFASGRAGTVIDVGLECQPLRSGGGGDQIDEDLIVHERLAPRVLAADAEQMVFDPIPLGYSRRETTNSDA